MRASNRPISPFGVTYDATDKRAERLGLSGAKGVIVSRVSPGLPAEAAGFLPGDLIMSIAAEPVRSVAEADAAFARVPADATIAVAVRRAGEVRVLTMSPRY